MCIRRRRENTSERPRRRTNKSRTRGGRERTRWRRSGRRWRRCWRGRPNWRPRCFLSISGPAGQRAGRASFADILPASAPLAGDGGPEREVFFAQDRKPGQLLQLIDARAELEVTIEGEPRWIICSASASCPTRTGSGQRDAFRVVPESGQRLQAALELGGSPEMHWHGQQQHGHARVGVDSGPGAGLQLRLSEPCTHYDLTPITISIGLPTRTWGRGVAEPTLKRRINQHLILQGS